MQAVEQEFKDWLIEKRVRARLSQTQLAKAIGVGKGNIWNWERGISKPKLDPVQTENFCLALRVQLKELSEAFGK